MDEKQTSEGAQYKQCEMLLTPNGSIASSLAKNMIIFPQQDAKFKMKPQESEFHCS
jgi:hypothetical protein